jgi:ubiquinone/menaquinone biosynthesis C-methylase UbiE
MDTARQDDPHTQRRHAWTTVWRSGVLHACAGSWEGNYGGEIREFWAARAKRMGKDSELLDLATGNGALPALLLEVLGADHLPRIEAVDLAEPSPGWLAAAPAAARARIRFHSGVALESLPFPEGRFHAVCSQFGFEYADIERAAAEVARVLAKGGWLALVCHHHRSKLAEVAQTEITHLDWLLQESELIPALRAVLPYAARRSQEPPAREARARLNAILAAVAARARQEAVPELLLNAGQSALGWVEQTVRSGDVEAAQAAIGTWPETMAAYRLRCRELIDNALDEAQVGALVERFAGFGLVLQEQRVLHESGWVLAWALTWQR